MLVSKAAKRYALALNEIADEQNITKEVLDDILLIGNTLDDSRELLLFLKSPIIKPDAKKNALEAIFSNKVNDLTREFLFLITKKGRVDILDQLVLAYIQQYNEQKGIIEVDVYSAKALDEDTIQNLKAVLEKTTSKIVQIKLVIQPELKGGLAVKINDTVIDGTIKHKLEQLEQTFRESSLELN